MHKELEKIHEGSIRILEETGVRLHHPDILEILFQKGIKIFGNTAFFTRHQVMEWVGKAPGSFTIYARNPKYNMFIGGDKSEFFATYGPPTVAEIDGTRRPALFKDYVNFLKLVHQSRHFKINGGVLVQPSDLKAGDSFPILLYSTVIHSDKCIMGGPGGAKETNVVMDMLAIIFGGKEALLEKPRIMTIINPSSPLQFDRTTLDTMLVYARYGQPMIITPAVMAGATGPVTLAGTIALSNAETLAGIAIAQMIREGTPVVYGSASSIADMKTVSYAMGAPESALCMAYCAKLARFYGLPSRSGGTLNDAKCVSVQSGYESMMSLLVAVQEKINFVLHSAGLLDSAASISYEQFIVDLEIIEMVERFMSGVKVDNNSLALDVISQVGPGGEFLTIQHTLDHFRQEPWIPQIGLRGTVHGDPNQIILAKITRKKEEMLAGYQKPEMSPAVRSRLAHYLVDIGFDAQWIRELS